MSSVLGTRALWSRILLGVTGLGAAVGVVYLFYKGRKRNQVKGMKRPNIQEDQVSKRRGIAVGEIGLLFQIKMKLLEWLLALRPHR